MTISPLAQPFPAIPPIAGVRLAVACAGYKAWTRHDLTLAELAPGTSVAGVLTQSKCPSPEVDWCRSALAGGRARVLVVNAGNSNAFTGGRGRDAVATVVDTAVAAFGCAESAVFIASTGVIGVPLPQDKARAGLTAAYAKLDAEPADWRMAADAIGTTDTFAKGATASAIVGGKRVTLAGIVKGSGMIAPDMATMLGFIFTDCAVGTGVSAGATHRCHRDQLQRDHRRQRHLDL